jgi:hypothetical protein
LKKAASTHRTKSPFAPENGNGFCCINEGVMLSVKLGNLKTYLFGGLVIAACLRIFSIFFLQKLPVGPFWSGFSRFLRLKHARERDHPQISPINADY